MKNNILYCLKTGKFLVRSDFLAKFAPNYQVFNRFGM